MTEQVRYRQCGYPTMGDPTIKVEFELRGLAHLGSHLVIQHRAVGAVPSVELAEVVGERPAIGV